jgi:Domain of unknown function (DUF4278)
MKLIYRGASYDYNPSHSRLGNAGRPARPTQSHQSPYTLIYRGLTTLVDPDAASAPEDMLPASYELIYRGTAYQVNRDAKGTATVVSQPSGTKIQAKPVSVPSILPKRYIGKVHQANLLANLQHRLQIAQARGDQKLIELLEAERQQIIA